MTAKATTCPGDEYEALAADVARGMCAALISPARCWVNTAVSVPAEPTADGDQPGRAGKRRVMLPMLWAGALEGAGLDLVDMVAWTSMRGSGTAWGSYEMPTAPNLRGDWEAVLVACKGGWERQAPAGLGGWRDRDGGWPGLCTTVWPIPTAPQATAHPAPFPAELPSRCIRLSTWPGEVVLDPFMGGGATLLAARALGRRAIGVEASERYCELAARRLSQGSLDFGGDAPIGVTDVDVAGGRL
jgi:hypothetical protein